MYTLFLLQQHPARFLHSFNRLEQGAEISFSESAAARSVNDLSMTNALNDLDENGGTIEERPSEDLKKTTLFILIKEKSILLGCLLVLLQIMSDQ